MRTIAVTAFIVAALAACGSKSKPAPSAPPAATDPAAACNLEGPDHTPATKEQCDCMGMTSVGDIGNGQVACPDGLIEVSKIRFGIEGGVLREG